jgi:hypothetical protein
MFFPNLSGNQFVINCSKTMSQLEGKDLSELKELHDDVSKFNAYVQSLPQIKSLVDQRENLLRETKTLADYNLSRQPVLFNDRQLILKKKKEAEEYIENIKRSRWKLINTFGQHNMDLLYSLSQVASMEAEEHSNRVANRYLDKETLVDKDVDEFMQDFVPCRKEFYLRSIKLEKCEEHLGIKSRKKSLIASKQSTVFAPRSSSPKRRAPLPPSANSVHSSRKITPTRKAPPPPKNKTSAPTKNFI